MDVVIPEGKALMFAFNLRHHMTEVGVNEFQKGHPLRELLEVLEVPSREYLDKIITKEDVNG